MLPVQHIASSVLADLIRHQPACRERTAFAWSVAVGPALARVTNIDLRDGVLYVTPKDPRWSAELHRATGTILARLQVMLGPEVTQIEIASPSLRHA
jgi:predicted nucleic acid-binding Zn ribbon protein